MPGNQAEEKKAMEERQIVIFAIGNEEFGVNINEVREIIRIEQITKIPNTNPYIKGVINLRGGIIVVIDLAMKLGLPTKEADKNTRILVVDIENTVVGMIVDSATEVLRLGGEQIQPPPEIITEKINSDFIEGVGILDERLLILLDMAKVLEAKEIAQVQQIQETHNTATSADKPAESKPATATEEAKEEVSASAISADASQEAAAQEIASASAISADASAEEKPAEDAVAEEPKPEETSADASPSE